MPFTDLGSITSVAEYTALVEGIADVDYLWFRGASNYAYQLEPSIFREKYSLTTFDEVRAAEKKLLTLFQQRSIPYIETLFIDRGNVSDWNYLFLMQHFGIPTRLLDFSENAFTALYFAVSTAHKYKGDSDAVVYILNPKLWNQRVFKNGTGMEDVLNPSDPDMDGYKPKAVSISRSPVAVFGDYNSRRIAAQQGTFILFGSDKKSVEAYSDEHNFDINCIYKIRIPRENIATLYISLRKLGFTESAIYPDIVGLSTDLTMSLGGS